MKRLASLVLLSFLALAALLTLAACSGVNADRRDAYRPCPEADLKTACGRLSPGSYYYRL